MKDGHYSKEELKKAETELLLLAEKGQKTLEFEIEGKKYILNLREYADAVKFRERFYADK